VIDWGIVFTVCIGVGLSAACGFRVFVPLLILSVASSAGYIPLSPGFQWLASTPAIIIFSTATIFEILGYFIPWVDHFLDAIATPLAVLAGVTIAVSVISPDMNPVLRWSLVLIAAGGAGTVQASTVVLRALSTAATGGLANPLFALFELAAAVILALIAIFIPLLAIGLLLLFLALGKKLYRKFAHKQPA